MVEAHTWKRWGPKAAWVSRRAHLRVPTLRKHTKFNEGPREGGKNENPGGRGKKRAKFWLSSGRAVRRGRDRHWPIPFWPIHLAKSIRIWVCIMAPKGGAPKGGGPKISRLFFPLPPLFSLFFCLSLCAFSWFVGGVCEDRDPQMLLGCRVKPRLHDTHQIQK